MLRLVSIMLFFNVTDEHLMLFARLKAGTSSNMRLESIVMHLQGSAHRVRSVCRVLGASLRHCVAGYQSFSIALGITAVWVFLGVFRCRGSGDMFLGETSNQPGTIF